MVRPPKARSGWAKSNKERVERLIAEGRMTPAGLAKIEAAKADGSWDKLNAVEMLGMPPDLTDAFAANPAALAYWDAFPRSVKQGILTWIMDAKRPETRARRIEETVTLAAQNQRANQWRKE